MTHKEYSKTVLGETPPVYCAAWHITFGGKCLNCGFEPEQIEMEDNQED